MSSNRATLIPNLLNFLNLIISLILLSIPSELFANLEGGIKEEDIIIIEIISDELENSF